MENRDIDELHRLWELKEKGAISEEEYSQLKTRIVSEDTALSEKRIEETPKSDRLPGTDVEFRKDSSGLSIGKAIGVGGAALLVLLLITGLAKSNSSSPASPETMNVDENFMTTDMNVTSMDMNATSTAASSSEKIPVGSEEPAQSFLTPSQANAARSAEQYLSMTGFSRNGLIEQLSSSAGEGYSRADATAAVDSLTVDWNENAAKSARQYLDMSGFSCSGLIEQLSSQAGDKYTKAQATYGARQAGAC